MKLKVIISILLTVPYFLGFKMGYTRDSGLTEHLLFPFSHANIFHLACNLLAIWAIKWRSGTIIPSIVIGFVASYMPTISDYPMPTMGASGIIFAAIGIIWGAYFTREYFKNWVERNVEVLTDNVRKFFLFVILPMTIMLFLPNVNFALHLYALYLGMLYAFFHQVITHK